MKGSVSVGFWLESKTGFGLPNGTKTSGFLLVCYGNSQLHNGNKTNTQKTQVETTAAFPLPPTYNPHNPSSTCS
ncbi:hypothetical protein JCM14076_14040 [Methylosoma difficile]